MVLNVPLDAHWIRDNGRKDTSYFVGAMSYGRKAVPPAALIGVMSVIVELPVPLVAAKKHNEQRERL